MAAFLFILFLYFIFGFIDTYGVDRFIKRYINEGYKLIKVRHVFRYLLVRYQQKKDGVTVLGLISNIVIYLLGILLIISYIFMQYYSLWKSILTILLIISVGWIICSFWLLLIYVKLYGEKPFDKNLWTRHRIFIGHSVRHFQWCGKGISNLKLVKCVFNSV